MHNLVYTKTDDISCLKGFHCGIYEMDSYIQRSLQSKLDTHKDLNNYIIYENNIVVALCTLRNNKLRIASISDVTAYTAVPFYKKCDFKAIEKRHPMSEVVKMIRIIEPA